MRKDEQIVRLLWDEVAPILLSQLSQDQIV